MVNQLRSEFRKLLSVRSTYIISVLSIALVVFLAFYVEGMRGADSVLDSAKVQGLLLNIAGILGVFGSLVAVLLVGHEYRYNTMMYTLSISNSRSKTLLAKITAVLAFGLVFVIIGSAIGVAALYAGLSTQHAILVPQHIAWSEIIWRMVFYVCAYVLFGLVLGVLLRNLVPAIAVLFILPSTVEPLLGLLLKENSKYLPISSLEGVLSMGNAPGMAVLSPGRAALVFTCYLAVAWIIGWIMFVKRDAV